MSHAAEAEPGADPRADQLADHDPLAEQFFSQPPAAREVALDDWQPRPLSPGERRAMHATLALLGAGATAAFALLLFADALLIMPAPLAAARERALPALAAAAPSSLLASSERPRATAAPLAAQRAAPIAARAPLVAAQSTLERATPERAARARSTAVPKTAATRPGAAARGSERARLRPVDARGRTQRSATDALVTQARRALNSGEPQRARELAKRAIRRAPERAGAYIVLAGALDALGDRDGMRNTLHTCASRAQDALLSACKTLAR